MKAEIIRSEMEEIIIDDIPIGHMILDENKQIRFLHIYDDYIHSKYEFELLVDLINKIHEKYNWVDSE